MIDPSLDAAYRSTTYWVVPQDRPRFGLRCGERSEPLERLLVDAGVRDWAFVTACNPRSRRLDASVNAERMVRLADVLRKRGLKAIRGIGGGDGRWPAERDGKEAMDRDVEDWPAEPSLLVLGIEEPDAIALGMRFDQNAILVGTAGGLAKLVWLAEG